MEGIRLGSQEYHQQTSWRQLRHLPAPYALTSFVSGWSVRLRKTHSCAPNALARTLPLVQAFASNPGRLGPLGGKIMNSRFTAMLGGLALAVTVVACGGSSGYNGPTSPSPNPNPNPGPGASVTITITGQNGNQSFSPNPGTVAAGQTVAWFNGDSIVHNIAADDGSFNIGNIAPGATSSPVTMSTAGAVAYHCNIHPTMVGSLTVQ
jgi:plastocyanin